MLGKILREARENKGFTQAQVAEKTHIMVQLVEEIEQEDYHRIAAPIYGRGFIKLYSECVDIDPTPLLEEFNAVFSAASAPAIAKRVIVSAEPKKESAASAPSAPESEKKRAALVPPTFQAAPSPIVEEKTPRQTEEKEIVAPPKNADLFGHALPPQVEPPTFRAPQEIKAKKVPLTLPSFKFKLPHLSIPLPLSKGKLLPIAIAAGILIVAAVIVICAGSSSSRGDNATAAKNEAEVLDLSPIVMPPEPLIK